MGGLEAEVLGVLWAADKAMVPAEVRAAMGDDLAYTTIPTILIRLWEKGLVHRTLRVRAYEYSPAVSDRRPSWPPGACKRRWTTPVTVKLL